jgi:Icc-related predicted phosphoesterase
MHVRLVSDLHVDFDKDKGLEYIKNMPVDADVLVVAGDVANSVEHATIALAGICARWKSLPVIFVPGNHEYYSGESEGRFLAQPEKLRSVAKNIHVLDSSSVVIDNKTFHGTTLWYPKPKSFNWSDFRFVKGLAYWIDEANQEARLFLRTNVKKGDIVITHTLPSTRCVAPRYEGDPDNRYFVSPCDDIILENQPSHWFFGHTHDSVFATIGSTLCISAPRGYPSERDNARSSPQGKLICL